MYKARQRSFHTLILLLAFVLPQNMCRFHILTTFRFIDDFKIFNANLEILNDFVNERILRKYNNKGKEASNRWIRLVMLCSLLVRLVFAMRRKLF